MTLDMEYDAALDESVLRVYTITAVDTGRRSGDIAVEPQVFKTCRHTVDNP